VGKATVESDIVVTGEGLGQVIANEGTIEGSALGIMSQGKEGWGGWHGEEEGG